MNRSARPRTGLGRIQDERRTRIASLLTVKKRLAALLVLPTLALGVSLIAAGPAAAAPAGAGGGSVCRDPNPLDGLTVTTCAKWSDDDGSAFGTVTTTGSNNTSIDLCVELVDANQHLVPGSRNCQVQQGPAGSVQGFTVYPAPGLYYAVSYFTSPTYWYGGESPAFRVS